MIKLPLVELQKYEATASTGEGGFSIKSASGEIFGVIKLPPDPASFAVENPVHVPTPSWAAQHAINTLLKLDHEAVQMKRNQHLSEYGREQAMAPFKDEALKVISAAWKRFDEHRLAINNQELQRYAIPQLDRADVVGYLRDREIRDTIRALGDKQAGIFEGASKDPELMRSILRSPMKFGALEQLAQKGWVGHIDDADPVGLERLKLEKLSIDWAQGVIGSARVKLTPKLGFSREQLYEKAASFNAASLFGFVPADVVRFERSRRAG
jgi:hypothetical protein